MNEKEEMQKNGNGNMQRYQGKKIMDLSSWPIFNLKPDYISQDEITMAYCWDRMAIIVTEDKNVYCFGLVHSKTNYYTNFTPDSKKVHELCGENIKTFTNFKSSDFVLALTEEGKVYISKIKEEFPPNCKIEIKFIPVFSLSHRRIVEVACGSDYFLALTESGEMYLFGSSQIISGDIIFPNDREKSKVRFKLKNPNVVHIACSKAFNIALTDEGKLYGWGYKEEQDTIEWQFDSPSELTTISDKIVKVACGDEHILALTYEGKVYAWSRDNYRLHKFCNPIMVEMPELVVDIAAWDQSSVAVDINGVIYVWGKFFNEYIKTPLPTGLWRIHDAFAQNGFNSTMHKPLTVSTDDCVYIKEKLIILKSLGAAFDNPTTSDFIIQVEGQFIYVHKSILKIRSQYFRSDKFQRDLIENKQNTGSSAVYTVSDKYSYIVYKAFLKYIYIGSLDVPSENALELLKLAHEFDETSLKRDCIQILKRTITLSNAAFLYSKAIEYNTEELEEFCFQFAVHNLKAVVLSEEYSKLDMNIKDRLIRRAAEEDVFET